MSREQSDRMKAYWQRRRQQESSSSVAVLESEPSGVAPTSEAVAERGEEVRIEKYDEAVGRASVPWTPDATARGRGDTREYLIRVRKDVNGDNMVSMLGPCTCGVRKREWHGRH